jgi:hypothetical protein
MHTTKKHTLRTAMQELQSAKHAVSFETANGMVKQFKRFRNRMTRARQTGLLAGDVPHLPICLSFNKAAIYQLMKAPGCVGIRFYPAINNKQQLTLVIVGVDEMGENILPLKTNNNQLLAKGLEMEGSSGLLDEGQASPPYPRPGGGL